MLILSFQLTICGHYKSITYISQKYCIRGTIVKEIAMIDIKKDMGGPSA